MVGMDGEMSRYVTRRIVRCFRKPAETDPYAECGVWYSRGRRSTAAIESSVDGAFS
jgi:hypothetical protein